tara:strand:- start:689 stop:1498 length:810 start_codon:yes stop_codon:yes gene_type:complete
MSLYVVPENQELLWNVIGKNKQIQQYFNGYNPDTKVEWFKSIIRTIYDKYKTENIKVTDLNRINKETITYMLGNIREQNNTPVKKEQDVNPYQPSNSMISTPPIVADTRQDEYSKQFEQRQTVYSEMNKKIVPDNVNFGEKIEDSVIHNMDDLIKQQMEQREYDMNNIPPSSKLITETVNSIPPKLQIDNSSNLTVSIQELEPDKKTVSWKDDNEMVEIRNTMTDMREEIYELKQHIETLTRRIDTFEINKETHETMNEILDFVEKHNK